MHELSIAAAIADIVHRHALGRRVVRVEVAVGYLRQAVPSALSFGFELVSMGTPLEGAKLEIRQVPVRGCCRQCGQVVEPEAWPLACPVCSGFDISITGGEELSVEAIEVEDEVGLAPSRREVGVETEDEADRRLLPVGV